MAKPTGGDILVETLIRWGVEMVFGLPGDGVNGVIEALRKREDRVRFIQVRHEEAAAFNACAYAKWTGKLGVCVATSGPGGIHLLNGLYDAKLDRQPVLAITGLQFHDLLDTFTQQDVELDKLFMDVAIYNARVMGPNHVENTVELACRTALAYRGVAHITVPVDAIIATDSGTITTWAARHLMIRDDMKFSCSGNLATMACGLPYAVAAAVAHPARQVICFIGDGGLTMLM